VYAFFREELNNEMIDILEKNPTLRAFNESIKDKNVYGTRKFEENYITPLGKYIQDNSELTYIDYDGPFGLNTNFAMNFTDDVGEKYYFLFHRVGLNGTELSVWTKVKEDPIYKKGTIGALNQGNLESEVVPQYITIESLIEKYMKHE